jgi:hypothetical protein
MAVCFQGAHFPQAILLTGVHWYVADPWRTRHVEELRRARGVHVDHASPSTGGSCRIDPTWQRRTTGASGRTRLRAGRLIPLTGRSHGPFMPSEQNL